MSNLKSIIDNKIYKALNELSDDLTKKYYNKEVFINFGIDQDRTPVIKKIVNVKKINIIKNDGKYKNVGKFSNSLYVFTLTDINDNVIWINTMDFL